LARFRLAHRLHVCPTQTLHSLARMPAAPIGVALAAEEAAANLGLPAGWRCLDDSTPHGSKLRRVIDPQGITYENEAELKRALETASNHSSYDMPRDDSSHGEQAPELTQEGDFKPSEAADRITEECTSSPQVHAHVAKEVPDHAEDAAAAAQHKNEWRRGRRLNPKAKALAVLQLVDGDVQKAIEHGQSQLQLDEQSIKQSSDEYVAAAAAVQKASQQLRALGFDVQTALEAESHAYDALKEVQQRRHQANKAVEAKKTALQACQEVLLIADMKTAQAKAQDAKRQKLDELQKAVADCERAGEEIRKQEREAREAMRQLIKENKRTSRLGAFGRRQREKMSTCNAMELSAEVEGPKAGHPNAGPSDQEVGTHPVHIKREVMQAFPRPRESFPEEPVIILDED